MIVDPKHADKFQRAMLSFIPDQYVTGYVTDTTSYDYLGREILTKARVARSAAEIVEIAKELHHIHDVYFYCVRLMTSNPTDHLIMVEYAYLPKVK